MAVNKVHKWYLRETAISILNFVALSASFQLTEKQTLMDGARLFFITLSVYSDCSFAVLSCTTSFLRESLQER